MNTFPIEIIYNIICHLPINYLFTINKTFNRLYNEHYYKEYLYQNYPDLNLRIATTYKDLCQKSLKEKFISFRQKDGEVKNFPIKGIKAVKAEIIIPVHLILRFTNDLYLYNENTNSSLLIESDINDFDTNTYIKNNEWFYLYDNDHVDNWSHKLILKIDEDFKHVACLGICMYAITKDTLYLFDINTKVVTNHKLTTNENLVKGLYVSGITDVSVLLTDDTLLLFDYNMVELGTLDNVEDVQGHIIKVNNKYHICYNNMFEDYNDHSENIFTEIYSGVISYPLSDEKFIDCVNYSNCYILKDDGLYEVKYSRRVTKIHSNNDNKRIKRITGNWEGLYEFYD